MSYIIGQEAVRKKELPARQEFFVLLEDLFVQSGMEPINFINRGQSLNEKYVKIGEPKHE
jgi:hypothetical protein